MDKFWQNLLALLFPPQCLFCRRPAEGRQMCCPECAALLEVLHQRMAAHRVSGVTVCGEPVWRENCGNLIAPFYYTDIVREGIHALKFDGQRRAASLFADWMVRCLEEHKLISADVGWDLVTAVPMYPQKRRERGYNQSSVLAKEVAKRLSLPLRLSVLEKVHDNETQHLLGRQERRQNVRGAYQVPPREKSKLRGKHILLVDDIITTGATSDEIAGLLRSCGAAQVDAVFAAATQLKE